MKHRDRAIIPLRLVYCAHAPFIRVRAPTRGHRRRVFVLLFVAQHRSIGAAECSRGFRAGDVGGGPGGNNNNRARYRPASIAASPAPCCLTPAGEHARPRLPSSPAPSGPELLRDGRGGAAAAAGGARGAECGRPAARAAGRRGRCAAAPDQELHLVRRCSHADAPVGVEGGRDDWAFHWCWTKRCSDHLFFMLLHWQHNNVGN